MNDTFTKMFNLGFSISIIRSIYKDNITISLNYKGKITTGVGFTLEKAIMDALINMIVF